MALVLSRLALGMTSGSPDNLEFAAGFLGEAALADCFIVTYENKDFQIVAASCGDADAPLFLPVFEQAAERRDVVIIESGLPDGIAAVMCVPIIAGQKVRDDAESSNMRQKEVFRPVLGCIYFQSGKVEHVFHDIATEISDAAGLLANCLEFYRQFQTASTDVLTGALTRKYMDAALNKKIESARQNHGNFSVIMADLDYFKHVNDTFGHTIGDEVLRDVTKIISGKLGKEDVLARYGGEEFLIMLDGMDAASAEGFAETLRKAVFDAKILGDRRDVTASFGAATYPAHAATAKSLVDRADRALYIAKQTGRNKSVVWDDKFEEFSFESAFKQDFFSGDNSKDASRIRSLYKIMAITAGHLPVADRLNLALDEIMSISGAADLTLFATKNGNADFAVLSRLSETGRSLVVHNDALIDNVIDSRQPLCLVDWDNDKIDVADGPADWQSVVVAPCVFDGRVKGVLYASVSVLSKEFGVDESSYIHNAATIISSMNIEQGFLISNS